MSGFIINLLAMTFDSKSNFSEISSELMRVLPVQSYQSLTEFDEI